MPVPLSHAINDPALSASIIRRCELIYPDGADPTLDRPAHVRAASAMAWLGEQLLVIQDDANFLALCDPASGHCRAIPLPKGPGGLRQFDDQRGNKADKLDLEACASLPMPDSEWLLVFGSGSTPRREQILLARTDQLEQQPLQLLPAQQLYAALRSASAFSGTELNLEGAVYINGVLRLFNRGNGAVISGRQAIDASCDLDAQALLQYLNDPHTHPVPPIQAIQQYALGLIDGCRITFTDVSRAGAALIFAAAAEASPDAVADGPVLGSVLGILEAGRPPRWTLLRDQQGQPFLGKVEGILPDRQHAGMAYIVVDRDDPGLPGELYQVALGGDWPA